MFQALPSKIEDNHDYVMYEHVRIPMSDGVELETRIYFPSEDGVVDFEKKYTSVLSRVAYMDMMDGTAPNMLGYYCAEQGYAVVVQAVRGTYLSEGELDPLVNEESDGVDTLAWIRKQPWSDGKIATTGISYMGATQYLLQLAGDVEGLETAVLNCPAVNMMGGGMICAQEFIDASTITFWPLMNVLFPGYLGRQSEEKQKAIMEDSALIGDPMKHPEKMVDPLYYLKLQQEYGLMDIPVARQAPFYKKWLEHRDDPDYFSFSDTTERKHDFRKPVLFQSSWCDLFEMNAINAYLKAVEDAPSEEIAKAHRLIVGTWPHEFNPTIELRKFPEADTDQRLFIMDWLHQQINGVTSEYFAENPVSIFVMGEDRWRGEQSWPLSDEVRTRFYIHSGGHANTGSGDGVLSTLMPEEDEPSDHYVYDPADPVVSYGGNSVVNGGMADQSKVEKRSDVLVYSTDVLEEDTEVTGNVTGKIFAATSAEDTDFFMKLLDVCPDGTVYNVAQGGRRGRYVKNGRRDPQPLNPGEIVEYDIDLRATSYVFKKGHRIRVEITSSNALLCDVNPNRFIDLNTCTIRDYITAEQTIYHDAERASYIELPVIPESHERKWVEWPYHTSRTGFDSITMKGMQNPPVAATYDGKDLPK